MHNDEIIRHFYTSFAQGDAKGMTDCYDSNIIFIDPVFGELKSEAAFDMWRMLLKKSDGNLKILFSNIEADNKSGVADWTAEYIFSKTGRNVLNRIHAKFEFQNGKIIRHEDHFNLWNWSQQAFGWKGLLFGWTPFMKMGIRRIARKGLEKFRNSQQ